MDEITNKQFTENKKHVLYLSYDGMTDPLGQSQVLPYLIGLSKRGFVFHLVSFEKEERFQKFNSHIQQICNEHGIYWYPKKYSQGNPLYTTVWDVQQMKKTALDLRKKYPIEILHCRSYISALIGLSFKRKYKTKFVFDMRGFWADERVDGGLWNLKHPIFKLVYSYFKRKEIAYFNESDYTISLTHNGEKEIKSWSSIRKDIGIQVIPCCVDLNLFNPQTIQEERISVLKSELKIAKSQFVLGYVGSIGTWYMLDEMLDFFKIVQQANSTALFLFVTGEQPNKLIEKAEEKGIQTSSIRVVSCLHQEVPTYISLFDASVFFIRPTFSKKASSPTKQGEIMAMGVPIICNDGVGDTDFVIHKYSAGAVTDSFSSEAYQKAWEDFVQADKDKMKEGAKEFYSLASGVEKYYSVYQKIYEK